MFLKIGTIVAIAGTLIGLTLSLIQQVMFMVGLRSPLAFEITRLISMADTLIFNIGLLVFLVAFLLSLKSTPQQA
jgi:hypothetical protein